MFELLELSKSQISIQSLPCSSHPIPPFFFFLSLQMLFFLSYLCSLIRHSNLCSSSPLIFLRSRPCPQPPHPHTFPSFLGVEMLGVVMTCANSSAVAFKSGSGLSHLCCLVLLRLLTGRVNPGHSLCEKIQTPYPQTLIYHLPPPTHHQAQRSWFHITDLWRAEMKSYLHELHEHT